MQDVVGFVFEQQSYQPPEKLLLNYLSEDAGAGNRNAVAKHLEESVVVEVHLVNSHDPVHGAAKKINDALDHGLLL